MSLFKVRRHVIYSLYNTGPGEPHVCLHECGCSTGTHFVLQSSVSAAVTQLLITFLFLDKIWIYTHYYFLRWSSSLTSLRLPIDITWNTVKIYQWLLAWPVYMQPAATTLDTNTVKYLQSINLNAVCINLVGLSGLTVRQLLHLLNRNQWNSRL